MASLDSLRPVSSHFPLVLLDWSIEQAVLAQVSLPGYQVTGVTPIPLQWESVILIVLLTEIFATAVKIKEENDLTI